MKFHDPSIKGFSRKKIKLEWRRDTGTLQMKMAQHSVPLNKAAYVNFPSLDKNKGKQLLPYPSSKLTTKMMASIKSMFNSRITQRRYRKLESSIKQISDQNCVERMGLNLALLKVISKQTTFNNTIILCIFLFFAH